ncbi:MAG: VWA domain-containing protein [Coriobacteriales bacterium]|nr:VWA domain-containing protein [Coriobacteriales bacterium]
MTLYKKISALVLACLLICTPILTSCSLNSSGELSEGDASRTLDAFLSKIKYKTKEQTDIQKDLTIPNVIELPDINTSYPLVVRGTGEIDIEIFSSTEKATANEHDSWLIEMGNNFNRSGAEVDGRKASVSVRSITSGEAVDYITSGLHVPVAYSPSNTLWGELIASKGTQIDLVEERLTGNVAGILMSPDVALKYKSAHGDKIVLSEVLDAAINGELVLGYTNPYASSTGLNMLASMLYSFDNNNPLSDAAVSKLIEFQKVSPPVAFTTAQMRDSASKGLIDAMVMEAQAYSNTPELSNYVFTPFGVRHDSPVYSLGGANNAQLECLQKFIEFCKSDTSQQSASRYGFNKNEDYLGVSPNIEGPDIANAQKIWKTNKTGGDPVVAVFVADTSGSMDGTPLESLKSSLKNASQYIGDNNYVGLVSFSDSPVIELGIAKFDVNHAALFRGAVNALKPNGGTATYDAVLVALDMIRKQQDSLASARFVVFVLSDGEQNAGNSLKKIEAIVDGMNVPVYTIGYNMKDNSELIELSGINEASNINATSDDVVLKLKSLFNANL